MDLQEQKVAYEQINHLGFWIETEICILFDLYSLHSCCNVGKLHEKSWEKSWPSYTCLPDS